jgi:hypothetical protein
VEAQKKRVEFFAERAAIYTDKAEIIKRIYLKARRTIYKEYKELWLSKEDVRFNAILICKLYENTTRLDRGCGVTMMRLTRDIIRCEDR